MLPTPGYPGHKDPPHLVYLEAIAGSTTLIDTLLSLTIIDAPASTPIDPSPRSQTDNGIGGEVGIQLTANGLTLDQISGAPDMLVGQGVTVTTTVLGPAKNVGTDYTISGSTFKDYIATQTEGRPIYLTADDLKWRPFDPDIQPQVPDEPNQVHFYWRNASALGQNSSVRSFSFLELDGNDPLVHQLVPISRTVKYNVMRPSYHFRLSQGLVGALPGLSRDNPNAHYLALFTSTQWQQEFPGQVAGMVFDTSVTTPKSKSSDPDGAWYITQLITSNQELETVDGHYYVRPKNNTPNLLDGDVEYGNILTSNYTSVGSRNDANGNEFLVIDSPGVPIENNGLSPTAWARRNDSFATTLMFVAPGDSKPVPLSIINSSWGGSVSKVNGSWVVSGAYATPGSSNGTDTDQFPTWTDFAVGGFVQVW